MCTEKTIKEEYCCESTQLTTVPLSGFKFDPRKRKGEGSRRINERTRLKDIGTPGESCEGEERGPENQLEDALNPVGLPGEYEAHKTTSRTGLRGDERSEGDRVNGSTSSE